MAEKSRGLRDRLKALAPLVDTVRLMLGAARHAFNRHSQVELEKIARLQDDFTLAIDPFFELVETGLKKAPDADQAELLTLQGILSQLEFLAHKISGLADPIRLKSNRGTILADNAFFHVNDLFSRLTGLMRALVDILLYDDASLKAYVLRESHQVREACFREEVETETRMMDNHGQPGASTVYVTILEHFRDSLGHLITLVGNLN